MSRCMQVLRPSAVQLYNYSMAAAGLTVEVARFVAAVRFRSITENFVLSSC